MRSLDQTMNAAPIRTRIDCNPRVIVYPHTVQGVTYKPTGFWYSVDQDWERWCQSEQPDWLERRYVHEVSLSDERMLFIRTTTDLDLFHERYKARPFPELREYYPHWGIVAEEYDGIEIAPYLWARRLDGAASKWYYSWDCASGCIWRPKGVQVKSGPLCQTKEKRG